MINFTITKKSKRSRARLGLLKTENGSIKTPALVPVATQATIKTLSSEQVKRAGSQVLISNTFHLHLKPGEGIVKKMRGLHGFMNWSRPLMTDSGGFQVFSLGFGRDFDVGKVLKFFPGSDEKEIKENSQPREIKITDKGVWFRSPLDGRKLFLGPRESIKIQEKLGADIIFAFDECTPPLAGFNYARKALNRTHQWAKICLEVKKSKQALFGIVQGSRFKELRQESSSFINSLGFDGYGIGGDLGKTKKDMMNILDWTVPNLDDGKPRHLLGIGRLEDMAGIIRKGIDLFDCTVPTHYARRGTAFIRKGKSYGRLNLRRSVFLKEKGVLDKQCSCFVCKQYSRAYIAHLFRAEEMTALSLITYHNLVFFNNFVAGIREKIKKGKL